MGPLSFANWQAIHRRFCALMWMIVLALTIVILTRVVHVSVACASRSVAPGTDTCVCARPVGPYASAAVSCGARSKGPGDVPAASSLAGH